MKTIRIGFRASLAVAASLSVLGLVEGLARGSRLLSLLGAAEVALLIAVVLVSAKWAGWPR